MAVRSLMDHFKMRFSGSLLLFLLLLIPTLCHGNLMGVDLGLSYIKVAVARPGKGLELVTNEQAKRKTPSAIGFTEEGERLFGDAAIAYSAKKPNNVILDGRSFLGKCQDNDSHEETPLCLRYRHILGNGGNFTGEEVIAMLLAMARRQAASFLGVTSIKDVAITVPAWFDERQRLAVIDAARIIGLNCLGVVNANTAAAIKYALDGKAKPTEDQLEIEKEKDKKNKVPKVYTQRLLFYDIGAGSASASIIEILSNVKTGIATSIKTISHASEKSINGRLLDDIIINKLADIFDKQRNVESNKDLLPTRDIPRVMMRLRKESQRVREVLSANQETFVSIGSLHDDIDLKTQLSRNDFEDDAKSILALIGLPAKKALSIAGLKPTDLHGVVPFGGITRTPSIQNELCQSLGIQSLNKSINTDEAAVMGSVFFAASLSSTFRVRKMDIEDTYHRGISVEIERDSTSGGLFSGSKKKGPQVVEVFPEKGSKTPSKKTVSLNRNDDFSMHIYLNADKLGISRFPQRTLYAKVNVKGVAEVLGKLKDKKKAKSTTPRVALSFHIDKSGLVRIGTAESSADETIVVEREVEIKEDTKKDKKKDNKTKDDKTKDEKTKDDDKDNSDDKKEDSSDEKSDETATESPSSTAEENKEDTKDKKKKTKIEKSSQTIVHRQALTVEFVEGEGIYGFRMSGNELENAQKVLKDLEIADKERIERADAFNSLEGFILEIRSKVRGLDEDDDLFKVTTEEQRDSLVSSFDEGEDWMYTEEAKDIGNLRKKHHELQQLFTPMENRAIELERRPKSIEEFRSLVKESLERIDSLKEAHITANSSHVEEFNKFPQFCTNLTKWIDETEQEQRTKSLTEDPIFSSSDVETKIQELAKEVRRIVKLDIPVTIPPTNNEEGKDDSKTNATDADSSSEPDLTEDGNVPPNPEAESAQADGASGSTSKDEL